MPTLSLSLRLSSSAFSLAVTLTALLSVRMCCACVCLFIKKYKFMTCLPSHVYVCSVIQSVITVGGYYDSYGHRFYKFFFLSSFFYKNIKIPFHCLIYIWVYMCVFHHFFATPLVLINYFVFFFFFLSFS